MDRVAEDCYINTPDFESRYEILRREYLRLAKMGYFTRIVIGGLEHCHPAAPMDGPVAEDDTLIDFLPPFDTIQQIHSQLPPYDPGLKLRRLAVVTAPLSARKLRDLPLKAMTNIRTTGRYLIHEAMSVALRCMVPTSREVVYEGPLLPGMTFG